MLVTGFRGRCVRTRPVSAMIIRSKNMQRVRDRKPRFRTIRFAAAINAGRNPNQQDNVTSSHLLEVRTGRDFILRDPAADTRLLPRLRLPRM